MEYKHNRNNRHAKLEQRFGRTIDILWAVDAVLVVLIAVGWLLMASVYAPCVPGGICIGHALTILAILIFVALMFLAAIGALVVFVMSRVKRVNLGSDVWKLLSIGVAWAVVLAVLWLFVKM